MNSPTCHTRKTLSEACGVRVRAIEYHTALGTMRQDKAKEKVPGMGTPYRASMCEKFVAAMQARHGRSIQKPDPNGRTVTIQITREDADRLVAALLALTAALLAGRE